jgi:hypothetical protein
MDPREIILWAFPPIWLWDCSVLQKPRVIRRQSVHLGEEKRHPRPPTSFYKKAAGGTRASSLGWHHASLVMQNTRGLAYVPV